jgi:hypothetical protein
METNQSGLQFDKVELAAHEARGCKRCKRVLEDEYFEAAGNILCRPCAEALGPKGGSALDFWRALGYGGGAALLGTIVWFVIIKVFHWELGIVAIAVGLFVGLAVRRGSLGRGGPKYQALAMALTYLSITSSYVPIVLQGLAEAAQEGKSAKQSGEPGDAASAQAAPAGGETKGSPSAGQWALLIVMVLGLAFAYPFLAGIKNVIGIFIIGIALYEAWKINRQVPITGPFRIGAPARAGPAAIIPPPSP